MRKILSLAQIEYLKSNGIAETLTGGDLYDYLYSVGYHNQEHFIDVFLPHRKQNPITGERVESGRIHTKIDEGYKTNENICLILPRGFAKTTRILTNILRDLLYETNIDLGYLSGGDLGQESVGRIRIELETNPLIQAVFGKLAPSDSNSSKMKKLKKRKQQLLQLTNGNTIETLTPGQRIRGRRKSRRVIDDPDEDGDSRAKRTKFRTFVFTTIYNTMLPGGSMIVLGTMVGNDCFILHLKNEKKWRTLQYRAIENGKSIREAMRPLHALEQRKKNLGELIFNQEFMHIPLSKENAVVKYEWIKRRETLPKFERTVLSIDPATKEKEHNDYTGIVFGGISRGKFYVIRTKQIKLSPIKLETYVIALFDKLKPNYILKEDNVEVGITERLAIKGLPLVSVHASKDKRSRLLQTSPIIELGDVLFEKDGGEELIEQICNYPNVQHDDIMDAFTQFIIYGAEASNNDLYIISV